MSWYLIGGLAALGVLVWLVATVVDYLPAPRAPQPMVVEPEPLPELPQPVALSRRYTAHEILGYRDLGGRRVAPTCPVTAGAASSAEALAAWDARNV